MLITGVTLGSYNDSLYICFGHTMYKEKPASLPDAFPKTRCMIVVFVAECSKF